MLLSQSSTPMTIRFTSSLTPDDENAIAPVLIAALSNILSLLPIAYAIRIDTADSKVYSHTGPVSAPAELAHLRPTSQEASLQAP